MSKFRQARFTKGKPCPPCPWREDSTPTKEQLSQLAPCVRGEINQGCHRQPETICRGFLIVVGQEDMNLALPAAMAGVDCFRDVTCPEPLHPDWDAIYKAAGMARP